MDLGQRCPRVQDTQRLMVNIGRSPIVPDGPKDDNLLSKDSDKLTIYAALSDCVYAKGVGSSTLTYESPRADDRAMEFFRSHYSAHPWSQSGNESASLSRTALSPRPSYSKIC